ncbi:hypothetical protein ABVT39_020056 [Epinephelus coioides]
MRYLHQLRIQGQATQDTTSPHGYGSSGSPNGTCCLEHHGVLNDIERNNRYVLVIQDYFTKWVEAFPLLDDKAVTVVEVLASEWVCHCGVPQILHSDQGIKFKSEVFQKTCTLFGIDKTRITPFRPQSDGQVEHFNATLQKILATTAGRCHWVRDLMIPYAVTTYRATKHSATGFTPNFMMIGREVSEPVDLVAGLPPDPDAAPSSPEYVQHLELVHQITRKALGSHKAKNRVGTSYEGPFFILGQLDDLVYRIQKGPKTKVKVVHHDQLKPYRCRDPPGQHLGYAAGSELDTNGEVTNSADSNLGLSQLFSSTDMEGASSFTLPDPVADVPAATASHASTSPHLDSSAPGDLQDIGGGEAEK